MEGSSEMSTEKVEAQPTSSTSMHPEPKSEDSCNSGSDSDIQNEDIGTTQEQGRGSPSEIVDTSSKRKPRKVRPTDLEEVKKPKLRTSKDIYDRLKWDFGSVLVKDKQGQDQPVDTSTVFVGYKDRFLGMCELQFEEFLPGGEIPFHRVYYFRTGGPPVNPFIGKDGEVKVREDNLPRDAVFIWDRDSRTDLVFKSGNSTYLKQQ